MLLDETLLRTAIDNLLGRDYGQASAAPEAPSPGTDADDPAMLAGARALATCGLAVLARDDAGRGADAIRPAAIPFPVEIGRSYWRADAHESAHLRRRA